MKASARKAEVEAELKAREAAISGRLEALQEEVSSTGAAVKKAVLNHPLLGVGLALGAGLIVGLALGGRKRTAGARISEALVDRVAEQAQALMAHGATPAAAVRGALAQQVEEEERAVSEPKRPSKGVVASVLAVASRLALQAVLREGVNKLIQKLPVADGSLAEASTSEAAPAEAPETDLGVTLGEQAIP